MHDMGYRVNQNILNAWAENAGESFDWYLEGYSGLPVLDTTAPCSGGSELLDSAAPLSRAGRLQQ